MYALDLGIIAPVAITAGVLVWRGNPLGKLPDERTRPCTTGCRGATGPWALASGGSPDVD